MAERPDKPAKRSGSEKRRLNARVSFRADFDEKARWTALAGSHGQSIGDLLRSTLDGIPPKPVRRVRLDTRELAQLLAYTAGLKDKLMGELGAHGRNFNQIAHRLNMDLPVDHPILARVAQMIDDHKQMSEDLYREFEEYRIIFMQALGHERRGPPSRLDDEPD
jgi:hypothetical protein